MKSQIYPVLSQRISTEVKACLGLALPLAGAQLAQTVTAFVDTVMIGNLGSEALAAGALGGVIFAALSIIASAIVSAASPMVASAYGAGKIEKIGPVVHQGFWVCVILTVIVSPIFQQGETILTQAGQESAQAALAADYLHAIFWGFLPALGFNVLRSFVTALSESRCILIIVITGTLLNIIANYLLILGKFGFPALGLAGAGWASTFALTSMCVILAGYILSQKRFRVYQIWQGYRFDRKITQELLKIGLPMGMLSAVEVGVFTVITLLIGSLGTISLAAHQIALQSASMTFTVPVGISLATTVRVGQFMGKADLKAARLAGYVGIGLGGMFMTTTALLFWLVPGLIVSLYLDTSQPENFAVLAQAKAFLGVAAMFQIFDGIQVCAVGALRGLKDTRMPMLIGIVAYWIIGLGVGSFLGLKLQLGGLGLWWGVALGLAVAAIILTWRFEQRV